jgi:unsaturated rhamnogalacturonyl hydrolase
MKSSSVSVLALLTSLAGCAPSSATVQPRVPAGAAPSSAAAPAATVATSSAVSTEASGEPALGPEAVSIQVKNPLPSARKAATVSVPLSEVKRLWIAPEKAIVVDAAGKPQLSQLVDLDGDEEPDELVFQTDLAASESKVFGLRYGKRPTPAREQFKVYGRFVRERHDDFVWENDRVAGRAYGPGLEGYQREPLVSSGLDVWVKRVGKLVVNDWYLTNDYHRDQGEGGDFYSVGKTRGCGGLGLISAGKLHVSRNFTASRVLANGPLRLVFELDYAPWDAGGVKVAETKRFTVDAGQSFFRVESRLKPAGGDRALSVAVGIAKHAGSKAEFDQRAALSSWEPFKDDNGSLGCALVLPPGNNGEFRELDNDYLLVAAASSKAPFVYYTGSAWNKAGEVADGSVWAKTVQAFSSELAAPPVVSVSAGAGAASWAARTCDSEMFRFPNLFTEKWNYDVGFVLEACEEVGRVTKTRKYFDYVKRTVDNLVNPDGTIKGYSIEEYNIDNINMGRVLFQLRAQSSDPKEKERYEKALHLLRSQMKTHPRNTDGGYWHKNRYPHQMWLDGLYMASPFLAEYATVFNEPALFDEVAKQLLLVEKHTRDPKTGLLYHGYDESRKQRWANPKTGASPNFWGRAVGWYVMALVDVLEYFPKNHPERAAILAALERTAAGISKVQDPAAGVWWQVLDMPKKPKNYFESSASAMFVYSIAKATRNGWLPKEKYQELVTRGYEGILEQFVDVDQKGTLDLGNVCKVAGLGQYGSSPYRDGSFDYYVSEPIVSNDPKGIGAFIVASLELDRARAQ